jgi:crossover junction endodeoxyribonuclease RusA
VRGDRQEATVPTFEFVVEGPPVSLRAQRKNARRYQRWVTTVGEAARKEWPSTQSPTSADVEVVVTIYYTAAPPDVDNVIKPILDALKGLVYVDDQQVYRVVSEKVDLTSTVRIVNPSPQLAGALGSWTEVVAVVVNWS